MGFDQWAYRTHQASLPLAAALLLTGLVYAILVCGWGWWSKAARGASWRGCSAPHVPPELVAQMARDPQRATACRPRTVRDVLRHAQLHARLRVAAAAAAARSSTTSFFSHDAQEIRARRGTLDKYIGDAIMAFWGAPVGDVNDHALHAVRRRPGDARPLDQGLNRELRS